MSFWDIFRTPTPPEHRELYEILDAERASADPGVKVRTESAVDVTKELVVSWTSGGKYTTVSTVKNDMKTLQHDVRLSRDEVRTLIKSLTMALDG